MTTLQANNKANELNSKFPNLRCEVTTEWGGGLVIKVCDFDKAKTLNEMFQGFKFTF